MPAVFSEGINAVTTSTTTTIGGRSDSSITYSTINSTHVNNNMTSNNTSVKPDSTPTKYIQLQTVRPQVINPGLPLSVAATTVTGPRMVNTVAPGNAVQPPQRTTLQTGTTGIPPGTDIVILCFWV